MIDRVDLLIAVIGIVVSILGSSTALWVALAKKADKDDLARVEVRLESSLARLEERFESNLGRLEERFESNLGRLEERFESNLGRFESSQSRIESKLDGLIIRLVPEGRA